MTKEEGRYPGDASWSMDDMPYDALERAAVADNELLLHLIASASFVEITSDVYTRNLADFFRGDAQVVDWLERKWQSEAPRPPRRLAPDSGMIHLSAVRQIVRGRASGTARGGR